MSQEPHKIYSGPSKMEVTGNISLDYLYNTLPFLLEPMLRDPIFPFKVRVFIFQKQVEIHGQNHFTFEPQFTYLRQPRCFRNELSVNNEIESLYNNHATIVSLYKFPYDIVVLS